MTEIHLNKPLYKEETATPASAPKVPLVRPARPAMFSRVGAVLIDVLVLHGILYAFAKFFSSTSVQLGNAGPYIGWILGFVYFAIGASPLTQGRTFGKALLRIGVADVSGSDLSWKRAIVRSLWLMSALGIYIVMNQLAESLDRPNELTVLPSISIFGAAMAAAWYMGNTFFAALDPSGRTIYDRWTDSIVIGTDAPAEHIQDHLRNAREPLALGALRRPMAALVITLVAMLGFSAVRVNSQYNMIKKMSPAEVSEALNDRQQITVPGFQVPMRVPMRADKETTVTGAATAADQPTTGIAYQYIRRAAIDVAELRSNPRVMEIVDRWITLNRKEIRRAVTTGKYKLTEIPDQLKFQVSFAEYSDLLFAWYAADVLTLSQIADFRDVKAAVAAEMVASGTAITTNSPASEITTTTAVDAATTAAQSASQTTVTATATTTTVQSDAATTQ